MVQSSYNYYSALQESITSLCKNVLQKRRLPAIAAAEERLSKQQSGNLKWQQDSFHHILNLMGLCKEGIVAESQLSAFRSHLLDSLVAAPADHDHSSIVRDKLIFLQELLYSNCISEEEYHSSKRPLLQRLAVQGAEIVGSKKEWSVIDLKDERTSGSSPSPVKQNRGEKNVTKQQLWLSTENPFWKPAVFSPPVSKQSGGGGEKEMRGKKPWGGFGSLKKKWKQALSEAGDDPQRKVLPPPHKGVRENGALVFSSSFFNSEDQYV